MTQESAECQGIGFDSYLPRFGGLLSGLQPHLQTIWWRPQITLSQHQSIEFPQPNSNDVLVGAYHPAVRAGRPLVLMLHGLPGDMNKPLIVWGAHTFLRRGYAVLRLNMRGAGEQAGTTEELYHAGRTSDIHSVIRQLLQQKLCPDGIVLVGYSFGANIALKLLGEVDDTGKPIVDPCVRGAAASCGPIDLAALSENMRKLPWLGRRYEKFMMSAVREEVSKVIGLTDEQLATIESVGRFAKFDEVFFARFSGFSSKEEYYEQSSAKNYMQNISVPALAIYSADDPFVPASAYEVLDNNENPNLCFQRANPGGHNGFHDRLCPAMSWQDRAMADFFDARC